MGPFGGDGGKRDGGCAGCRCEYEQQPCGRTERRGSSRHFPRNGVGCQRLCDARHANAVRRGLRSWPRLPLAEPRPFVAGAPNSPVAHATGSDRQRKASARLRRQACSDSFVPQAVSAESVRSRGRNVAGGPRAGVGNSSPSERSGSTGSLGSCTGSRAPRGLGTPLEAGATMQAGAAPSRSSGATPRAARAGRSPGGGRDPRQPGARRCCARCESGGARGHVPADAECRRSQLPGELPRDRLGGTQTAVPSARGNGSPR